MRVRPEVRRRLARAAISILFLLLTIGTIYSLSNSPANYVTLMRRGPLVKVPARLEHCEHRYYRGGRRGHTQIDCRFGYQWGGRQYEGYAESLRYEPFETRARLDRAIGEVEGNEVTAYVDSQQPSYAIAFIKSDFMVAENWGIGITGMIVWWLCGLVMLIVVRSRDLAHYLT